MRFPPLFAFVFRFAALFQLSSTAMDAAPQPSPGSTLEEWMRSKIIAREPVDLHDVKLRFAPGASDTSKLRITGKFLRDILTTNDPQLAGVERVEIKNAGIQDALDLRDTTIRVAVAIEDCVFEGEVQAQGVQFLKSVSFSECRFVERVDFRSANVGGDLLLENSVFSEEADVSSARVAGGLFANGVQFDGFVSLNSARIEGGLQFGKDHVSAQSASFGKGADLTGIEVGMDLMCNNIHFHGNEQISLGRMVIKGAVSFDEADFGGPVTFSDTVIAASFSAQSAHFRDRTAGVDFSMMRTGRGISLERKADENSDNDVVHFDGPVNFSQLEAKGSLIAKGVQFNSEPATISFATAQIGDLLDLSQDDTTLKPSRFAGNADFTGARIGFINAERIQFTRRDGVIAFVGMIVREWARFSNASFLGATDFSEIRIGNSFMATNVEFRNPLVITSFYGAAIERTANFNKAFFAGPTDFGNITVKEDLILSGAWFAQDRMRPAEDRTGTNFTGINVKGAFEVHGTEFRRFLTVKDGTVGRLDLDAASWPQAEDDSAQYSVEFTNLKIGRIGALYGTRTNTARAVRRFVDRIYYSASVYESFERALEQDGYKAEADQLHIDHQWRKEAMMKHGGFLWFWTFSKNRVLFWLVGFGRRPWYAFGWCILTVIVGTVVFSIAFRSNAFAGDGPRPRRDFNSFIYSLGKFLPFLTTQTESIWRPRSERYWLRLYVMIHSLLGWLLIPLGFLALTGIVR